jgi:diaminohydroxyphosphoribosylaminopyrimidine deaminase/5-amino-6-(5-phosphoribosylamino)uracil reductase
MTDPAADRAWMARAIDLSRLCPRAADRFNVGAVLVDSAGQEISTGFSREGGDPHIHAEESALGKLPPDDPRLRAATLYSTLEPCSERSSHPVPCTRLVIAAGIPRVVIAWREPALLVADCQGVEQLAAAGVEVVEVAELAAAAREVNAHLDL